MGTRNGLFTSIRNLLCSERTCAAAHRRLSFVQLIAQVLIRETMHRLTARLLLIFALTGNLVPLALAAATPAHACCLRKVANHCHTPAAQLDQPSIRAKGCCNHDCCRAATTARSACPSPLVHGPLDINVAVRAIASWLDSPRIEGTEFRPSRAPPAL
jgi:hypothetical protein